MFENIRKLRLEHNLTQQELADIVGITQQCINNYENRNTYPSYDVVLKMAEFFDVTLDYLCFGESAPSARRFDILMRSYTDEDLKNHDRLFSELPVIQKRSIDSLILILSESNEQSGKTG